MSDMKSLTSHLVNAIKAPVDYERIENERAFAQLCNASDLYCDIVSEKIKGSQYSLPSILRYYLQNGRFPNE